MNTRPVVAVIPMNPPALIDDGRKEPSWRAVRIETQCEVVTLTEVSKTVLQSGVD